MTTAEKLTTIAENQQRVYEAGQISEYDRFWDTFQKEGKRNVYSYAFWRSYWNDECYNPKYPIFGSECSNCFYLSGITDTKVPIHFSGDAQQVFRSSSVKIIRKIICDEGTSLYRWFEGCGALESVTFEGVFTKNNLDVKDCKKLSHDSLMSLINVLEDKTADTSGTTWLVSLGATNIAKLSEDELALIEQKGWSYA